MNYRIFGPNRFETLEAMQHDVLAKQSLAAVFNGYLPWSNASMRPSALQLLLNDIMLNGRTTLVEFGSGLSTVILGTFAAKHGAKIVSFDHEAAWQKHVAAWIPSEARAAVELVHAPLAPFRGRNGESPTGWYDVAHVIPAIERSGPIDVVIVDGPPAYQVGKELARLPALEVVHPYLAKSVTVVLDDIMRAGEKQVAAVWSQALGTAHRDLAVEAGVGLWQVGGGLNISY